MLLEIFASSKKVNLGDVPVGEIVLVKFRELRQPVEPDIDVAYAALVTKKFRYKTRVESIGFDDAEGGAEKLSLGHKFQCVWLKT